MSKILRSELFASLPPEWSEDLTPRIKVLLQTRQAKLVIVDDDPTGSQAVYDIPLLTRWTVDILTRELRSDSPAFFILTNSRALLPDQAAAINLEIGENLRTASVETGKQIVVLSRGDSTLRGHFPAEVEALAQGLKVDFDAWLVVPALPSEGRVTVAGIHYVTIGDKLTPVGETAYAQDATFGFRASDLKDWVAEKTAGRISASEVHALSLNDLRQGGPTRVYQRLLDLPKGAICVVDAVSDQDLEVFTAGLLLAEAHGRQFLGRVGPGVIPIQLGKEPYRMLDPDTLPVSASRSGGLIIVGSYVPLTGRQVARLQERELVESVKVEVSRLLQPSLKEEELARAAARANTELGQGRDVLLYTSRELVTGDSPETSLEIGHLVSNSLIEILDRIQVRPRYILAKGGITSNDVATQGLGVKRAMVLGQITKGVSVWLLGPESRYKGMVYIVFPGNIGQPETLAEVVQKLNTKK